MRLEAVTARQPVQRTLPAQIWHGTPKGSYEDSRLFKGSIHMYIHTHKHIHIYIYMNIYIIL